MSATEVLGWVEAHYGKCFVTHANGVFVAAVSLYEARVAIGCGSDASGAVCDLYLELHGTDRRADVPPPSQPWERKRRERRASRREAE
jgi:hypothetical protein